MPSDLATCHYSGDGGRGGQGLDHQLGGAEPWVWAIDFDGGENCSSAGGHHRTHVRMVCDSQLSLTNGVTHIRRTIL